MGLSSNLEKLNPFLSCVWVRGAESGSGPTVVSRKYCTDRAPASGLECNRVYNIRGFCLVGRDLLRRRRKFFFNGQNASRYSDGQQSPSLSGSPQGRTP